jgi:very-short-patch-repair endonuclease
MRETLPTRLSCRPFTVAEALDAGVTRQRLRRSDLHAPFHGARVAAMPATLHDRCRALAPLLEADQFVSHITSAALWGLPLPARYASTGVPLHVTSIRRREPRRAGVTGHRDPRAPDPACLGPIPVSAPVRAWTECRTLLELDDLVVVGDALVGRWSEIAGASGLPLRDLEAASAACLGRGTRRLQESLALVRVGSRSPAETRLRLLLARGGIPEPELNFEARTPRGAWLGIVDFAFPDVRLGLEYEGEHHFSDIATFHADIERRERFAEAGWRTIRVTSEHLRQPDALVARVRRHLLLSS